MKNVNYLFLIICFIFLGCTENKLQVKLNQSATNLNFKHYEQALFNINQKELPTELEKLKKDFPVFIGDDYKNSTKLFELHAYLNNDLNIRLFNDWNSKIQNYDLLKTTLNKSFAYYKHYYTNDSLPTIYTYISSLNYEEPIIYIDNNILIGIDLFFGADYEVYPKAQIPQYIFKNHQLDYLAPVVMRKFAQQKFKQYLSGKNMLENMIALGKIEYFIEAMMPTMMDSTRFQFTSKQMVWCYAHEKSFWKHLTMKQYLFSKDFHTYKKFLQPGPFVSSMERDSPGRAGIFIGYKIVKAYMNRNPEISINDLMTTTDFTSIFKDSKYNP